ncbi:MerR family transcriptional regulator [Hydrogenovibrio sp. 3SP14C1]|uniref:MerR family transcriptional regulator n=1 Tax=Hydrogenovibrio sp. 3SP14C1 TaxID=3038774 RepID=UPI00241774A4|nr:MerR family transcriptional regulator [Hydrogenovibrio sp. 3SP14C1]MDG4812218.1 MerR family transcriptional regulator [Hydrogenovibrio sp. 3SP14C1]
MVQPKSFDSQKQLEIDLPDKKYFTIGEVSEFCQLKSHVLRYWEQVFPQLQPNKRRGRRYYQKRDVQLVFEIKSLLHEQGFTIPGAKARLNKADGVVEDTAATESEGALKTLRQIRSELNEFQTYISQRY